MRTGISQGPGPVSGRGWFLHLAGTAPQYTVNVPFQREAVPIGIVVTVKIIDRDTGKILCTDTRTLEMVQR